MWRKEGPYAGGTEVFETREQLEDLIQQIVSRVNRTVNAASPIADARLEDGSRVHVVLPPVALDGPVLTIRKFPEPITMERLISLGSVTETAAGFLKKLVKSGYNLFISGGTGSGKTTFLNALSEFIPEEERLITIEDSAELQITHVPNLVRLETRAANHEGSREITIRDLIRASLRMRPDRILVGEVRGAEALEMLQSMNTGHSGSISTGHANSSRDMLLRLETMVLMGADLPLAAIRSQIASAIDIFIHLGRLRDRSRKVLEIEEVTGIEDGEIVLHPLFQFKETKGGKNGRCGRHFGAGGRSSERAKAGDVWGRPGHSASGREEGGGTEYETYCLSVREWIHSSSGAAVCALFAYVFYRNFFSFFPLSSAGASLPAV